MIYVVSHFYPPVSNPPAVRMGLLAKILVETYGRENVLVLTGRPNYPDGHLSNQDRWRIFRRETGISGEDVLHLYEFPAPFRGFLRKTLGYISFALSVFLYFLFHRISQQDLVFITSGPVFPAYAVYFLSRLRPLRYVIDVRDLSPQTVAGMGFMKESSRIYQTLKSLSDRAYRGAHRMIAVAEGMCEYVDSVIQPKKCALIYNPVDLEFFRPMHPDAALKFRKKHGDIFADPRRTVFLFAGVHSVYRDLPALLRALKQVKEKTSDFVFLLIGYGEDTERLKRFSQENGLNDNVRFLPHMSREMLADYIGAADFCYFSSMPNPIFDMEITVKALEYLACDKFLVAAHRGLFCRQITDKGLALISPPGDVEALARNLMELIQNKEHHLHTNGRSRQFIVDNFSAEQFRKRTLDFFADLVPLRPDSQPSASS